MGNTKKVGLLVGQEWSFPPALMEEINRRSIDVAAEYAKLGGTPMNAPCPYAVLVDRISHEIPYYRAYMKNALLQGTYCINNPFWWSADDKFFGASLLAAMDIPTPRTVVLPMHTYPKRIGSESLRNLIYPLDWDAILRYIGFPVILKDAWGDQGHGDDRGQTVYKINTQAELVQAYDETGTSCMIVQEYIEWDQFVRCLCIGQDQIMPIKYDPHAQEYHLEHEHLSPEVGKRIVSYAQRINQALGYDMNSIEFAIKDTVPYAIDIFNPAPDLDVNHISPHYFEWAVKAMADFCIEMAHKPKPQRAEQRWAQFL